MSLFLLVGIVTAVAAQGTLRGSSTTGSATYTRRAPILNPPRTDGLWPGLRIYDALQAVRTLRYLTFMMQVAPDGKRSTIRVRSVGMRLVEKERLPPPYPDGEYESRWDLVLNGVVIDPREFAIEFDQQVINLAALFSYGQEFYPDEQAPQYQYD